MCHQSMSGKHSIPKSYTLLQSDTLEDDHLSFGMPSSFLHFIAHKLQYNVFPEVYNMS